jgi:hypothetical protein
MYLAHDAEPDIIYIFATKDGTPANPDGHHNLAAAGDGAGRETETYTVTVRKLTGAGRDRIYAEQTRRGPGFGEHTPDPLEFTPFLCSNIRWRGRTASWWRCRRISASFHADGRLHSCTTRVSGRRERTRSAGTRDAIIDDRHALP